VAETAARIGFSLFSKAVTARRRLWRQLVAAARDDAVATVMAREVQAYLERLGELAYAEGLPLVGVSLHRLVVVPRGLLKAAAYRSLDTTLGAQPPLAAFAGAAPLSSFFSQQVVEEMDLSIAEARPSPKRTLPAGADWVCVGLNATFPWRPRVLECAPWNGHHYVLELTREPITRAVRNEVRANIERFEASLPSLSRTERDDILRRASMWQPIAAQRSRRPANCA
jgi:hypothetical protein